MGKANATRRDRINFSRAILARFIRDSVTRAPTPYAPWLLKPHIAHRYSIPAEMPEDVREKVLNYKRDQMDKRKRDRDERLGINTAEVVEEVVEEDEKPDGKRRKKNGAAAAAATSAAEGAGAAAGQGAKGGKGGKSKVDEKQREKEAEEERKRNETRRSRFHKYCLDGMSSAFFLGESFCCGCHGQRDT
jgi:hypothetical protein